MGHTGHSKGVQMVLLHTATELQWQLFFIALTGPWATIVEENPGLMRRARTALIFRFAYREPSMKACRAFDLCLVLLTPLDQ